MKKYGVELYCQYRVQRQNIQHLSEIKSTSDCFRFKNGRKQLAKQRDLKSLGDHPSYWLTFSI